MISQRITLLFLMLLSCFLANAATFTVTSNADSGPGTLRQALLDAAANGGEHDVIHFNLADQSEAGRTITLLSQLPDMPRYLEIDGTTQPGPTFGVSDAKVKITLGAGVRATALLRMENGSQISIYGLYLVGNWNPNNNERTVGIYLTQGGGGSLGALAKGNVINACYHAIQLADFTSVSIRASFFGLKPDGVTVDKNYNAIQAYNIQSFDIGGAGLQRNVFGDYGQDEVIIDLSNYVLFNNNFFGTDVTGNNILGPTLKGSNFSAYGILMKRSTNTNIVGCVFANLGVAVYFLANGENHTIRSNRFGVGAFSDIDFGNRQAVLIEQGARNQIPHIFTNIIAYNENGITVNASNAVSISRNSFYCNINKGITVTNSWVSPSMVSITSTTPNSVSGTAFPNSLIELFYADECNSCQGKTYIGSIPVGINGTWTYNGGISGTVVATATNVENSTSAFSGPTIVEDNAIVKNSTCGQNNGSVTGIEFFNATNVTWQNDQGQTVGGNKDLLNVGPGRYKLMIDNGICSSLSKIYDIKDEQPDLTGATVKNAACTNNGAITGIKATGLTDFKWYNIDDNGVVGTEKDLKNVTSGKYKLIAGNGQCNFDSPVYEVKDDVVNISATNAIITDASCSMPNGSIKGLQVTGATTYTAVWKNQQGAIAGNTLNLIDVPGGSYTLTVTSGACVTTYGPQVIIGNDFITIDDDKAVVNDPTCGQSNGSITGIILTGGSSAMTMYWRNQNGDHVATTKELTGQPPGTYTFVAIDNSQCGGQQSRPFTIVNKNTITLNDNGQATDPDCNGTRGSIKGITVTGATTYQWIRPGLSSTITTPTPELFNALPGTYRLLATNGNGCSQSSKEYVIRAAVNDETYGGITKTLVNATCGLNNGSITAAFTDATLQRPKSVRWVKQSNNQTVGNSMALTGLDAGNYDLYATAQNGCERFLITYTIIRTPALEVTTTGLQIIDDNCGLNTGSIGGFVTLSPTTPTFTWTNVATGQVVGNTANLSDRPAGTYQVKITDGTCDFVQSYTINNSNELISAPAVPNLQLCGGGDALLAVSNPSPQYGYRLYDDATSSSALATEVSGKFKINVKTPRSYYVSQFKGNCESARGEVKISVGISNVNIANAFTPNADGINDTWKISSIDTYPNALVQIFNRHGDKIFESRGYNRPFDGTCQGQPLPVGAYYYIINLNTGCSLLTGSLTLIR